MCNIILVNNNIILNFIHKAINNIHKGKKETKLKLMSINNDKTCRALTKKKQGKWTDLRQIFQS